MTISKELLLTYFYLLVYIVLSSGVFLYNKWVLSPKYFNFSFPITLTMIHMGFSGLVAFFLIRVFKVVSPVKMTLEIYSTCVIPISAFFAASLWFGNTAYLFISVAFIQMLKALMPVATFVMAVICGTDKLRCDVLLNMFLVSIGVVISSYGEIHFNIVGTVYQVTGIFAEALRLVLTQVLLQKKGLTLNPITSLYYIAPCRLLASKALDPRVFRKKPLYLHEVEIGLHTPPRPNLWDFTVNVVVVAAPKSLAQVVLDSVFQTTGFKGTRAVGFSESTSLPPQGRGKYSVFTMSEELFPVFQSFVFLFIPWYLLEKPEMEVSQIQFNFWIFFSNALCALALNFSIFLVIGRTGAVTIRVAGVLKDWILISLSTLIFPESTITTLNITGYAIALCGVVMYNYLKMKDVRASQLPVDAVIDRTVKELKMEKKSSDLYLPDDNADPGGNSTKNGSSDPTVDEEAPLITSTRISHLGRSNLSS